MRKLALSMTLVVSALSASVALAETRYTGDTLQGVPVISELDITDLPSGKMHRFFFQGASDGIGQHFYVPVIVAKGAKDGPELVLNSGIHGDEVNGIRAIQKVMASLDPTTMSGSVVAVTGANPNAMNRMTREWKTHTSGGASDNLNRLFPGKQDGSAPHQHAWLLWNKLWQGEVDYVLDFHSQATGHDSQFFIYADYSDPRIQHIAELYPADQIKKDPGEEGSLETAWVKEKTPAITLEIGGPRSFNQEMIDRAVEGTRNVMIDLKMMPGEIGRTAKSMNALISDTTVSVRSEQGGYHEVLVAPGDAVKEGQVVAKGLNIFGDTIKEYTAPVAGVVLSTGSDATREPRTTLVRIMTAES